MHNMKGHAISSGRGAGWRDKSGFGLTGRSHVARLTLVLLTLGTSVFSLPQARAQDELPPAPTTPKPDPELAMTAGELRLDGKITAITGTGTFVIEATSFTSPAGKLKEFEDPKSKKIVVPADAILRGMEGPRRFKFADLKLKEPVAIIGKSAPDGSLQARIVLLLDANILKTVGVVVVSPPVARLGEEARTAYQRGQLDRAIQLYKQANEIAVASGDAPGQMLSSGNMSVMLLQAGQPQAALQSANKSLSISKTIDDKSNMALAYSHVAGAQLAMGQREAAVRSLEDGLSAARGADSPKVLLSLLTDTAEVVMLSRKGPEGLNRAASLYTEALPLARNDNDDEQVTDVLVSLALIRAMQGNAPQARDFAKQAQDVANNLTDLAQRGAFFEAMGVVYEQTAVQDEALSKSFLNKALEAYNAAGSRSAAERVQHRLDGQLKGLGEDTTKPGGDNGGGLMDG